MSNLTHKIAYSGELAEFFGVQPRRSRPEESRRCHVYEIVREDGFRLRFGYAESDNGDYAELIFYQGEERVFDCDFDSVRMVWDFYPGDSVAHLILLEGSTNVTVHKNPWRVSVSNSTFYQHNYDPNPFAGLGDTRGIPERCYPRFR